MVTAEGRVHLGAGVDGEVGISVALHVGEGQNNGLEDALEDVAE